MFQDEMYLEEGDRVFSDIQITLKKKKTNTIDITPENIDEYFVDLSNIYIGTDPSDTGNPFYWLDGKIVSAPITITDTHSLWIEFKSAINNQTISFNAVLSTPILFSIINVTVCDCDGNEIA